MQETNAILGSLTGSAIICAIIISASDVRWSRRMSTGATRDSITRSILGSSIFRCIGCVPVFLLWGNNYGDSGEELRFDHKGVDVARRDQPVDDLEFFIRSKGGQFVL